MSAPLDLLKASDDAAEASDEVISSVKPEHCSLNAGLRLSKDRAPLAEAHLRELVDRFGGGRRTNDIVLSLRLIIKAMSGASAMIMRIAGHRITLDIRMILVMLDRPLRRRVTVLIGLDIHMRSRLGVSVGHEAVRVRQGVLRRREVGVEVVLVGLKGRFDIVRVIEVRADPLVVVVVVVLLGRSLCLFALGPARLGLRLKLAVREPCQRWFTTWFSCTCCCSAGGEESGRSQLMFTTAKTERIKRTTREADALLRSRPDRRSPLIELTIGHDLILLFLRGRRLSWSS